MPLVRATALAVVAVLSLASCGGDDTDTAAPAAEVMTVSFASPDGTAKGTGSVAFGKDGATITVNATGLTPGLHGLHVHKIGACAADSPDPTMPSTKGAFLSAGGHLAAGGQVHGNHDGDLPSLLVRADGSADLVVVSDRLTRELVLDGDGSALMIHDAPDNSGNIPSRYAAKPDATTAKTGDSGKRVACAVLKG